MKLQPETEQFILTLNPADRKKFLAYLKDADDNIVSAEKTQEIDDPRAQD